MIDFTGERVVPWSAGMRDWAWVIDHHIKRYTWVLPQVVGKHVLDLGCGTGYGSFILSWVAAAVVGVDISVAAIDFAETYFDTAPNIIFRPCDVVRDIIPMWSDEPYDVVTCFEVLEHLNDPASVMRRTKELAPGGVLFGSMPVNDPGQFHMRTYNESQIIEFVKQFGEAEFFTQGDNGDIRSSGRWHTWPKYILWRLKL